jgi:hypothetical protein
MGVVVDQQTPAVQPHASSPHVNNVLFIIYHPDKPVTGDAVIFRGGKSRTTVNAVD